MSSLHGKDGADGAKGADGSNGANGHDGSNGVNGKDGINGNDGRNGVDGKDGAPGLQGPKGEQGVPGTPGHDGATGPAGAPGQQGPKGDTGSKGDKGDSGTAQSLVYTATFADGDTATLPCPNGSVAIGGGVAPGNSANSVRYTNPANVNGNRASAWTAATTKANGKDGTSTIYVVCAPAS
jgi:hypothetical protein